MSDTQEGCRAPDTPYRTQAALARTAALLDAAAAAENVSSEELRTAIADAMAYASAHCGGIRNTSGEEFVLSLVIGLF